MTKPTLSSPGRKKLAALGVQLPLIPTGAASDLPKHTELLELRYKVAKGVQQPAELERKEKISTEVWIRHQERLGLDVIVDGEMNRGDMVGFFSKKIDGFEPGGTVRCYGNRYYKKPLIKRKLEWRAPITVNLWRASQRMTHKVLKAVVTGPYTLMDWSFNDYYSSREAALSDLIDIVHKEIGALAEAGAKIIQIEELALSSKPQEFTLVADAIKEVTRGIKSYVILHHAYGDLSLIWKKMQKLPVDNLSLEMANSHFCYLPLLKKLKTTKDISIGLIDSHSRTVEQPQQLRLRCKELMKIIPPAQLWLTTDSGLKTRTIDETVGKLKALAESAMKIRESF